jgi:hypothetical protein
MASPISPMNAFIRTNAATTPAVTASPGSSVGRVPNGVDTSDNSKDFKATQKITPDAANM